MSSTSTAHPRQPSDAGHEVYALSCVNCRQRKVKCAKIHPCPHCLRGGLECIFPSRKKDRAPRRNKNHELLNRLAKLEAIVGQVDPALAAAVGAAAGAGVGAAADSALSSAPTHSNSHSHSHSQQQLEADLRNPQKRCPASQPTSKDDPAAKYVSGEFWANLSTEVEGIKAALEQPSDSEDDHGGDDDGHGDASPDSGGQGSYSTPSTHLASPAVFGNTHAASAAAEHLRHPPPESIKKLRHMYFRNVDPLIKILHRPTIEKEFDLFMINPEDNPLSTTAEALFFAMYFAAITSLSPESCMRQLGEDRSQLVVQYRQAVEVALARADYLNNTSLESLQALTLYDTCLRNHAASRPSWAILALVYRLAQAIGLHRDGNGSTFSPYEAEMRRRLWSQILVLDVRAAQDRGTEPMIHEEDFNTIPPTNIDDDDFNPDTKIPLPQLAKDGPTDITFSLCTYRCSSLFIYIHGPRSKFIKPPGAAEPSTTTGSGAPVPAQPLVIQSSEEDIIQRIKALEMHFVAPAALYPGHYPTALAASVVRLTTLIFWLTIQYPFQVRQPTIKPRVSREHMLQTAIAIIELQAFGPAVTGSGISAEEYQERFIWWQDGYVQWHPLAVALAELCVQTEGILIDRAWQTVERVFPIWSHKVADAKKGALWRPIRKLYKKAKERRAEAQMRRLRINEDSAGQGEKGTPLQTQTQTQKTDLPHFPQTPQPELHSQNTQQRAAAGPSPLAAATEVGPTGIPFTMDFGDMSTTDNVAEKNNAQAGPTEKSGSSIALSAETMVSPPGMLYQNAHNQWTIDFGELDNLAPIMEPQQDFDMMDWSAWNDFVNDANVNPEDQTSPSSEGK